MSLTLKIPSPAGAAQSVVKTGTGIAGALWAVPKTAWLATRATSVYARTLLDPDGFIRQIDDAVIALGGLKDIAASLDKIGDMSTAIDNLVNLQDELEQLGNMQRSLDRIAELDKPIASLARTTEALPDLALAAEALPRLVDQVHAVQQVVIQMDGRIKELSPAIIGIAEFGVQLEAEIDDLGDALAPISQIAGKLPGGRKAAREAKKKRAIEERETEAAGELPAGD